MRIFNYTWILFLHQRRRWLFYLLTLSLFVETSGSLWLYTRVRCFWHNFTFFRYLRLAWIVNKLQSGSNLFVLYCIWLYYFFLRNRFLWIYFRFFFFAWGSWFGCLYWRSLISGWDWCFLSLASFQFLPLLLDVNFCWDFSVLLITNNFGNLGLLYHLILLRINGALRWISWVGFWHLTRTWC